MKIKKIIAFAIACILAVGVAGCSNKAGEHSVEAIKARGKITIATESQYAPFCFKDEDGNYMGIEPKLMQAIADDLGVELEIMDIAFDSVIPTVQAGGADIGIAGFTPNAERKDAVDFSMLYNLGGQALVVLESDVEKYNSKEALKGLTLGVQQGSLQKLLADTQFADCEQFVLPTVPSLVEELKAGNVAGVLMDEISATQHIKTSTTALAVANIPVDISDEEAGSAAALMKGNKDLQKYLNELIQKLWDEGKLDAWFEEAKDQALKLGML